LRSSRTPGDPSHARSLKSRLPRAEARMDFFASRVETHDVLGIDLGWSCSTEVLRPPRTSRFRPLFRFQGTPDRGSRSSGADALGGDACSAALPPAYRGERRTY